MPQPGDSTDKTLDFNPIPSNDDTRDPLVDEALDLLYDPLYVPKRLYRENQDLIDPPVKAAAEFLKSGYDKAKDGIERVYDSSIDQLAEKPLTTLVEGPMIAVIHGLISRTAKDEKRLIDQASSLLHGTSDMGNDFRQRVKDADSLKKDGRVTAEWRATIGQIKKEKELARNIETQLTSGNLDDLEAIVANNTSADLRSVVPKVNKALELYHTDIEVSVNERGRLIVKQNGRDYQVDVTSKRAEVKYKGEILSSDPGTILQVFSNQIVQRIKEEVETGDKDRRLKPLETKAPVLEAKSNPTKPVEVKAPEIKTPAAKAPDTKVPDLKNATAKDDDKKDELAKMRNELRETFKKDAEALFKQEREKLNDERKDLDRRLAAEKTYFEAELGKINAEKRALESLREQIAKERTEVDAQRNGLSKTVEQPHYSGSYYSAVDSQGRERKIPVESEEGKAYLRNYSRNQQPQCRSQKCGS